MEKTIFDLAVDELLERQYYATLELHKRFKNTKPFRMEPMSDEDRIAEYMQWAGTPMEQELRRQLGDAEIDKIHMNIQQLADRGARNGERIEKTALDTR